MSTDNLDRGDDVKSPLDDAGKGAAEGSTDTDGKSTAEGSAETDKLEGEETPEERAERERQEAEEAKKRNIRIPKHRFDEVQAKARAREQALLEQIEQLKSGQQTNAEQKAVDEMRAKIEELQDKYEDLILDGKKDEARKVRKQVDTLRDRMFEHQTTAKSDAARKAAIEELTYNAQLAGFESSYPALNPDSAEFDEAKTTEVASLLGAFTKSGMDRATALGKAVKYVMGPPPQQKTADAAKTLAEERARKAREKAADANARQPANTNRLGLDTDKAGGSGSTGVDILRMSQESFAKLDDELKSKMRGDEL